MEQEIRVEIRARVAQTGLSFSAAAYDVAASYAAKLSAADTEEQERDASKRREVCLALAILATQRRDHGEPCTKEAV